MEGFERLYRKSAILIMCQSTFEKYASVVLDISIEKILSYGIPDPLLSKIKKGMRVEVPVKGQMRFGYVYAIKSSCDYPKVQAVSRIVSEAEVISDDLFELALWMAKYYCVTLGDAVQMMLPAVVRKAFQHKQQLFVMRSKSKEFLKDYCEKIRNKASAQASVIDVMLKVTKGILLSELLEKTQGSRSPVDSLVRLGYLQVDIVRVDRSPFIQEEYFKTKAKVLTNEQSLSLEGIHKTLQDGEFEVHLIYGVTGSGKTEIYLQAIEKALDLGKGAIMLIPEISLTEQTIHRFRGRFEEKIAILHHRLSVGERFDEWHRIQRGEAQIVIGARSAVFSPVRNLGIIIVDEEHENSYKQNDSAPCYHARDVAVMRGKMIKSAVILGSATPSLESYYNAEIGKYRLNVLENRAQAASIPKFTIVDMKLEFLKSNGYTNFSEVLLDGIKSRQSKGEQSILFLNRRGYHTTFLCNSCTKTVRCSHCDVNLTFHLGDNLLACHLCGFTISPSPARCPSCQSSNTMKYRGVGTEQIERSLHAILPDIRTIRMDADTTRHKGSHQKLLREFGSGKADVLIGTQMIAKGLHFPEVTLVGILNSDTSLNIPDFRASESSFQLMTQVAGRAGRGYIPGEVIIQTCIPENATIAFAARQDYRKFYDQEICIRKAFNYPPFVSLVKLTFSGPDEKNTEREAQKYRQQLRQMLSSDFELFDIIPAGHAKVKDKFRFQLLLRGPSIYSISNALKILKNESSLPRSIHLLIDVNPTSTFF